MVFICSLRVVSFFFSDIFIRILNAEMENRFERQKVRLWTLPFPCPCVPCPLIWQGMKAYTRCKGDGSTAFLKISGGQGRRRKDGKNNICWHLSLRHQELPNIFQPSNICFIALNVAIASHTGNIMAHFCFVLNSSPETKRMSCWNDVHVYINSLCRFCWEDNNPVPKDET